VVLVKVICGVSAALKKSPERRWSSRCWVPVLIEASWMVALATEAPGSSATTTLPSNSSNLPRTLLIRWRTVKPISLWLGVDDPGAGGEALEL
jgi:hypothetical protein